MNFINVIRGYFKSNQQRELEARALSDELYADLLRDVHGTNVYDKIMLLRVAAGMPATPVASASGHKGTICACMSQIEAVDAARY